MESNPVLLSFILLFLIFLLTVLYFFNILPLLQTLPLIIKNSHRMVDWAADLLLTSPTGTVTVFPFVFTADPSNVEHITKSSFNNYERYKFVTDALQDLFGDGILNVNGDQWKLPRKLASYEFSTGSLRTFVLEKVWRGIQERLLPLLESASRNGEVLDLQGVLERFAFDNICSVVFDYAPDCLSEQNEQGLRFFRAFEEATNLSMGRMNLPFSLIWKFKKLLNIGSERRFRECLAIVDDCFFDKIIQSRNFDFKNTNRRDFLSQFSRDGRLSEKSLRDMLVNFVSAGRDTTPSALTWFFWMLSSRPRIVRKILDELRLIRADQLISEPFTLESLREMHYLHAAIAESMRLHPPVTMPARQCRADDTLPDGTAVKKGWIVLYNTLAMGRSERIWGEDCAEFRPERWLVDGVFRPRNPIEYSVFHSGPAMCLGKDMAFIQMKAVAASILESFEMEVVEERRKHEVRITLKMEGGLPVRVKERN